MNRRVAYAGVLLTLFVLAYAAVGAPPTVVPAAEGGATTPSPPTAGAADAGSAPPPAPDAADVGALVVSALAPGFELGRYRLPIPSALGPGETVFVRLDPKLVNVEVRAASLRDGKLHKASEWGADPADARAVAVMNSSMFQDDWLKSVGHLQVKGEVQNPRWAKQQNSVLVADPREGRVGASLLDLACLDDSDTALARWTTQVQSIRLLGCAGEVVWSQEARAWSSALIGQDRAGRLLFLHTRAPYTMHDLGELLRSSPLDLVRLHYTEGGPEASLYVRGPGVESRLFGSFETGFREDDGNDAEWELPNVVVAVAR